MKLKLKNLVLVTGLLVISQAHSKTPEQNLNPARCRYFTTKEEIRFITTSSVKWHGTHSDSKYIQKAASRSFDDKLLESRSRNNLAQCYFNSKFGEEIDGNFLKPGLALKFRESTTYAKVHNIIFDVENFDDLEFTCKFSSQTVITKFSTQDRGGFHVVKRLDWEYVAESSETYMKPWFGPSDNAQDLIFILGYNMNIARPDCQDY